MTTPTNWPNPERPGVPPNPERDGLYAMRIDEKFIVRYWTATRQHYSLVPGWENGISPSDASVFTFCGEILAPAQISEMLAAERERIKGMVARTCNLGNIITASQRNMIIAGIDSETAIRNLGAAP
ncbi:hypothetical protein AD947_03095 [Acetobacter tropicalis]|uniref:Uncharacterized protein n=1 Tax=Acetobacter tropicalis TaxID=104102 RepID=A0A149U3K7_9PROT|nr:hypothetical protein [Acetobacter tropicalis]KXV59960.1 hypothetical protein AD947_03095 [Acetobacter tropicalis]